MIANKLVSIFLIAAFASVGAAGCKKKSGSGEFGPDCETEFDKTKYQDKYVQCKACEKQHRGMGTMEKDCKSGIAQPWK